MDRLKQMFKCKLIRIETHASYSFRSFVLSPVSYCFVLSLCTFVTWFLHLSLYIFACSATDWVGNSYLMLKFCILSLTTQTFTALKNIISDNSVCLRSPFLGAQYPEHYIVWEVRSLYSLLLEIVSNWCDQNQAIGKYQQYTTNFHTVRSEALPFFNHLINITCCRLPQRRTDEGESYKCLKHNQKIQKYLGLRGHTDKFT